jgi:hypothetical protein
VAPGALRWVAEQHAVGLDVVAHLVARDEGHAHAAAVVGRWESAGLVRRDTRLAGAAPTVWPTTAGMRAAGIPGRGTPPPLGLLAHARGVSLVRLAIERAGGVWTSERALRRARPFGPSHCADARFRVPGGPETAVEVELTPKGAARLRAIIGELTLDHDAVLYVVDGSRVRVGVERAVDALAVRTRVFVADLERFALPARTRPS